MPSGKYAYSICQRSGLRYPYNEMVREPGTNLWVHYTESDGADNRVDLELRRNARNFEPEVQALENVYPDVPLDNTEVFIVDSDGNVMTSQGQFGVEEIIIEEDD